jgi:hypothetical protein
MAFCSFRSILRTCRDAGNGKKRTRPAPQQDKAAADAAGRKAAAGAVPGSESEMAEGNQSPPKAEVDDSPLQHAMDRNKECEYSSPSSSARYRFNRRETSDREIQLSIRRATSPLNRDLNSSGSSVLLDLSLDFSFGGANRVPRRRTRFFSAPTKLRFLFTNENISR